MKRVIVEVRILIEVPNIDQKDGFGADLVGESHDWLKKNVRNMIDWAQGDVYPEEEGPLQ